MAAGVPVGKGDARRRSSRQGAAKLEEELGVGVALSVKVHYACQAS